jgi:HD-GYP domain-containing protein (c-di-GMP phosphodiesterase class II)
MGEAIEELNNCAGSQFDKEIVDVFIDQLSRFGPQYLAVSAGSGQLGHNNLIN